jgi:hypothetical protein
LILVAFLQKREKKGNGGQEQGRLDLHRPIAIRWHVSHPAALPSWHKGEELQASTQIIVQCTVKMVKIETLPPFDAIT